ncbi:unannotated protein [freshwater metagenome]|uniref:Unannotated protein n=1 Tax=freshwater metagenome TaxID=449393 RepID=A0A6J6T270_9ZZZZ
MRGGRLEEVALRSDMAGERGDDLLANRVEGRVRHLREELLEVVEDQTRARRQHRHRGVGAHRSDRLSGCPCHRLENDPQVLLGVAEGLLTPGYRLGGVDDVLALRQLLEMDEPCVQPIPVRRRGCQVGLYLVIFDDAPGDRVDEEHPAGLQPSLAHDGRGVQVEHPRLGRKHDKAIVGHPEPTRAKAISVEYGTDDAAVAEADVGRAVPGLHERRVKLIEGPPGRIHRRVVLPRLRDHHEHGVRQRASAEMNELEDLVEGARVAAPRRAHRKQAGEITGQDVGGEHRLTRLHPVAIALDRVDLAVVRNEPVRVSKRPGREGVRRETRVDERERRRDELLR